MFMDPMYLMFLLPGMALSMWASWRVKSVFKRYSKEGTARGLTGADAARLVLSEGGVTDVTVEEVSGFLTDHYDPTRKILRLSPENFRGPSVSAIGVACHEAGHALQHKDGYKPLWLRSRLVPIASFGSRFWYFILIAGVVLQTFGLVQLGILVFATTVAFQLVTLPVEFDATRRAKAVMTGHGILQPAEAEGAARVLDAAAWTYIAAAVASILQLLYFLIRFGMLGGRRNS